MKWKLEAIGSLLVAGALAGGLTGCASVPEPTDRMESSAAAIRAAEEVGANKVPQAALHLQLAHEQEASAKRAMADGDKEQAGSLLMRAQSDAELAVALARENQTHIDAEQATQKSKALDESGR